MDYSRVEAEGGDCSGGEDDPDSLAPQDVEVNHRDPLLQLLGLVLLLHLDLPLLVLQVHDGSPLRMV